MPKIYLEKEDKILEVKELLVSDILKSLKINPTTVLITKNNELILDDVKLSKEDRISIIPVISGG
ncbi:MoaD/ThiS family protein [Candidatus Woesearchaeota archaeon]|nr:MoaD/ThiS family protein [Candidatus Woesearchaeota archaeon]